MAEQESSFVPGQGNVLQVNDKDRKKDGSMKSGGLRRFEMDKRTSSMNLEVVHGHKSWAKPSSVSRETFESNWDNIFRKKEDE